ncbi:MAG: hypothetical protein PUP91_37010, partial [Rhizonema sp. PD37]|nr:hypothetical protein [Rhizonema sp. PD37]
MKYNNNRQFLDIVEYASLAGSALGTIVAVASGQLGYAAAPLTLAISLNVVNRRSSVANMHQTVQSLQQKVQALPAEPVKLNAITYSLQEIKQKTELLTQQFNAREEPKQIEELKKTIAHLPQKVDLSPITQSIEELKQSSTRLETQEIANLTKQLNAFELRLDNFPKPVDLSEILAEVASLQAIDKSSINDSIIQLQSQNAHICQQMQQLLSPFDPSFLEKRIAELEESDRTNIAGYHRLTQLVHAERARVHSSIISVQNNTATAVVEVRQYFLREIESLHATIHALPTPTEPVDFNGVEAEIETLKLQIQAIDFSSITSSFVQLQTELQTQINQINHQIKQLPQLLDLDAIRQQLSKLDTRNRDLFKDYVERLVPTVKDLRSDKVLTQKAIVDISHQLNAFRLKLNNQIAHTEPVDLSTLKIEITDFKSHLPHPNCHTSTKSCLSST